MFLHILCRMFIFIIYSHDSCFRILKCLEAFIIILLITTLKWWVGAKPNLREDWWRFLLLGATGVYLNQLLFILGLQLTSSTQAAIMQVHLLFIIIPFLLHDWQLMLNNLLQPCIPVFTTALTLILRMEKFSILKVIGILFSAAGAVIMVCIITV